MNVICVQSLTASVVINFDSFCIRRARGLDGPTLERVKELLANYVSEESDKYGFDLSPKDINASAKQFEGAGFRFDGIVFVVEIDSYEGRKDPRVASKEICEKLRLVLFSHLDFPDPIGVRVTYKDSAYFSSRSLPKR